MIRLDASVGGLSNTSKMPCYSWGLPVQACTTGAKLINNPNSACFHCYANKGMYRFPVVKTANERRLAIWQDLSD